MGLIRLYLAYEAYSMTLSHAYARSSKASAAISR